MNPGDLVKNVTQRTVGVWSERDSVRLGDFKSGEIAVVIRCRLYGVVCAQSPLVLTQGGLLGLVVGEVLNEVDS